jgi:asparaginyl-tRNA synthetase
MKRLGNFPGHELDSRSRDLISNELWKHVARINQCINTALLDYFSGAGCVFLLAPSTTRLLSSPKSVYSKKSRGYVAEAEPMRLEWFGKSKQMFLSQSAQIYMEMYTAIPGIKGVYAITDSFRKEASGPTHLAEFHMVECEMKISQKENKKFILNMVRSVVKRLVSKNLSDLSFFLLDEDTEQLKKMTGGRFGTELTFEQAMDMLHTSTRNRKYTRLTTKNFGAWEEVKLTSELDDMAIVTQFPFDEGAFYQARIKRGEIEVGDNADFIWPYFREIAGSTHRARSFRELSAAIKRFNLPMEDYSQYLETRRSRDCVETSGFGLGWERFVQALLKMPYVQSVTPFPRVEYALLP